MWKAVLLVSFAGVVVQRTAAGGAESVSFHGYIPDENIRARPPEGDGQTNDVYLHLLRRPTLRDDEVLLYPRTLDFGLGIADDQDPEARLYQIFTTEEIAQLERNKHDKHGKHAHDHKVSKDATKSISKLKPLVAPASAPIDFPRHPSYPSPPHPNAHPPGSFPPHPQTGFDPSLPHLG